MRRWLAILFMVLIPFQLGWAAVSAYCQHESGAAADHLGHHEHRHVGDDRDFGSDAGAAHVDCGFCHAAGAAALTSSAHSPVLDSPPTELAPSRVRIPAPHPTEPERPKWPRAA